MCVSGGWGVGGMRACARICVCVCVSEGVGGEGERGVGACFIKYDFSLYYLAH